MAIAEKKESSRERERRLVAGQRIFNVLRDSYDDQIWSFEELCRAANVSRCDFLMSAIAFLFKNKVVELGIFVGDIDEFPYNEFGIRLKDKELLKEFLR